ncbi:MAG: hypothetical protein EA420_01415 [Candidatus Competibacteraceae bacterium]|nr:MAG: hypothetical protein EA420_01415 [Candidatus Competibacteraceae bacterium]
MLARLNTGSFSVAVVGEFKRGKTTFINALLGRPVLPADVVPCSATVSRLIYGRTPRAEIHFRTGEVRAVELAELDRYITQMTEEAAMIAATVRQAVVAYPTLFCQNNVAIIDTPGLSDTEAFTRLTLDVVPHSDAAVFVVSALAPFSETEREFLMRLLETFDLDRLLFVVNQIDQVGDARAADRVVARVRNRIAESVVRAGLTGEGTDMPGIASRLRVFGLSAYLALQAKLARDAESLAASRLPDFEHVLEQFLVRDRGLVSLRPALKLLTEGGRAVLAAQGNGDPDPTAALDPRLRHELDAIVSEASTHEHQLPERIATIRPRLTQLVAALEQELIEAAHAITEGRAFQNPSLKPNELGAQLSAAVERAIQQANGDRRTTLKAVLDGWIAEELATLDALSQRLDAVAARLATTDGRAKAIEALIATLYAVAARLAATDEVTRAVCIGRDRDWMEAYRRQVDMIWPDFTLGGPIPHQAGDLLDKVARPTLGLLGNLVGSETVARGVFSVVLQSALKGALCDGMKTTVRAHAKRTIHRLLTQAALPAHLDRIVTEIGGTLRDLLYREVESLVHRAYTTQATLAALEERQRAQVARRQADVARMRDRAENILAASARLTVYLSR